MKKRHWKRRGWKALAAGKTLKKPSISKLDLNFSFVFAGFAEAMNNLAKAIEELFQNLREFSSNFIKRQSARKKEFV